MEKTTIRYCGRDFMAADIDVRSVPGYEDEQYKQVRVAEHYLGEILQLGVMNELEEETAIDNTIFFYVDDDIMHNGTEEDVLDYLRKYAA